METCPNQHWALGYESMQHLIQLGLCVQIKPNTYDTATQGNGRVLAQRQSGPI